MTGNEEWRNRTKDRLERIYAERKREQIEGKYLRERENHLLHSLENELGHPIM